MKENPTYFHCEIKAMVMTRIIEIKVILLRSIVPAIVFQNPKLSSFFMKLLKPQAAVVIA